MKKFKQIALGAVLGAALCFGHSQVVQGQDALPEGLSSSWYSAAVTHIEESEYYIRFNREAGQWHSPNRAHNLRIHYTDAGFRVEPRLAAEDGEAWSVTLTLESIGRSDGPESRPTVSAAYSGSGATLHARHPGFTIEYINDENGMRQNFILDERPAGEGELGLRLGLQSELRMESSGEDAVRFVDKGSGRALLSYRDLYVYDADGLELPARMEIQGTDIVLLVNDSEAVYPLTVDPLATSPAWTASGSQSNADFGIVVASAGDVNADGYSDIMVAAPNFDGSGVDNGKVFLWYGASGGPAVSPDWTAECTQAGAQFGSSIATAGDVDGNGYSDIIIGAPYYELCQVTYVDEGAAFVYYSQGAGGLAGSAVNEENASWRAGAFAPNSQMGFSVATAGDVNGDGYSEIIVGANVFDNNGLTDNGGVFLWEGGPDGLDCDGNPGNADWFKTGDQDNMELGYSVAAVGDVNRDGFTDIIAGAPFYQPPPRVQNEGGAFVWRGSVSGPQADSGPLDSYWAGVGAQQNCEFGAALGTAGDVNGDGYTDFIIAAPDYVEVNVGRVGYAFVFYGSSSLLPGPHFATTADWQARGVTNFPNPSRFGNDVGTAGDVNGDGYADVIISQPNFGFNEGGAFIWHGGPNGLRDYAPNNNPNNAEWQVQGAAQDLLHAAATAGDVNGDGYSDVLTGALGASSGNGEAALYYGSPRDLVAGATWVTTQGAADEAYGFSVSTAGDVNGDGFADVVIGAPFFDNGNPGMGAVWAYYGSQTGLSFVANFTQAGTQTNGNFGWSVSTAGDVDNDGASDIIVGAPLENHNGWTNNGAAYLIPGLIGSGLGFLPSTLLTGENTNDNFGWSVSVAGDVNRDGFSDVAVGAPEYGTSAGAAYIYRGSLGGLTTPYSWRTVSNQANAQFGWSVATAGDANGDSFSDLIVGAPGQDDPTPPTANTGGVTYWLGSPAGVQPPGGAATLGAANQTSFGEFAGDRYGSAVATAGDFNADSYSDVVVGAPNAAGGSGVGYLILSDGVLALQRSQVAGGSSPGAQCGASVGNAGDLNGDGYGDICIGSPGFDPGSAPNTGMAFVYYGAPTPPYANGVLMPGIPDSRFGASVSTAGDVNGDGYSDLIVGLSFEASAQPGFAFCYYGAGGDNVNRLTRQYQPGVPPGLTPIQNNNGATNPDCSISISHIARSAMGRSRVKLVWEDQFQGIPFQGTPITNGNSFSGISANWTDIVTDALEIYEIINPTRGALSKWRVRVRYHPATMIDGQTYSRWFYAGIHDRQAMSLTLAPVCQIGKQAQVPTPSAGFVGEQARPSDGHAYPNPAAGELRFRLAKDVDGAVRLQVLDALGRVIRSGLPVLRTADQEYSADMSGLPDGAYTIRAIGPDGTIQGSYRFVKQ